MSPLSLLPYAPGLTIYKTRLFGIKNLKMLGERGTALSHSDSGTEEGPLPTPRTVAYPTRASIRTACTALDPLAVFQQFKH